MPKFKHRATPDEIQTLVEALAQSPLVSSVSAGDILKYNPTDRTGTVWLSVTFTKIVPNTLPISLYERRERGSKTGKRDTNGYVYLLPGPEGTYKIGKTVNPKSRRKTFNVKLPFYAEFLHVIKTDDMHQLEKLLHQQFADKRVRGEFFQLAPDDVQFIQIIPTTCTVEQYKKLVKELRP